MKALSKKGAGQPVCPRAVGRPRCEAARLSIMRAAYTLLYKAPVREITAHMIAAEAGVSTATLYRWWPTKEAVLLDAYVAKFERLVPVLEGSPLAALKENLISAARIFQGRNARVTLRLLMAIQEDDSLHRAFWEKICGPRIAFNLKLTNQAIECGELPAGTDPQLFVDSILGVLLTRLLLGHAPVNNLVVQAAFERAVGQAADCDTGSS